MKILSNRKFTEIKDREFEAGLNCSRKHIRYLEGVNKANKVGFLIAGVIVGFALCHKIFYEGD